MEGSTETVDVGKRSTNMEEKKRILDILDRLQQRLGDQGMTETMTPPIPAPEEKAATNHVGFFKSIGPKYLATIPDLAVRMSGIGRASTMRLRRRETSGDTAEGGGSA
ncbi:hypothetical protein L484_019756 [Morus notabilis]|uniref:Uncharacterized protein n=1 Tax=Morus notabilis TaxID=981085 RepID=W9QZB6_9ROSA|nr:hypothetical protein L484_019756 [Morus notabilis]